MLFGRRDVKRRVIRSVGLGRPTHRPVTLDRRSHNTLDCPALCQLTIFRIQNPIQKPRKFLESLKHTKRVYIFIAPLIGVQSWFYKHIRFQQHCLVRLHVLSLLYNTTVVRVMSTFTHLFFFFIDKQKQPISDKM